MAFSQNLYNQLQRVEQRLQTASRYSLSLKTQAMGELLDWCAAHELPIAHWVTTRQVIFDQTVLQLINETLQQLSQPTIEQAISGLSRFEQGQLGNRENKNTSRPKQGRVLVLQPNTSAMQLPILQQSPAELVLDVAVEQLDLQRPSSLLAVENLDMFYLCLENHRQGKQVLPVCCADALMVYRGHQHDAASVKTLVGYFAATQRPTYYLGDFDPAGLNIALDLGFDFTLLPALEVLHDRTYTERYNPEQQQEFERLLQRSQHWPKDHVLQVFLQILLQEQRSSLHQRYSGALECLPLPK